MASLQDPDVAKDLVKVLSTAIVSAFGRDFSLKFSEAIKGTFPNPRVGVSVLIRNGEGEFLVGERIGSHGAGTVQTPGGHIDYGEQQISDVAVREVKEETGLDVTFEKILTVSNDVFYNEGKHYFTTWAVCRLNDPNAEPKVMEKDKCKWWAWKTSQQLVQIDEAAEIRKKEKKAKGEEPDPPAGDELFLPLAQLFKQVAKAKASDISSFIASTEGLPYL